jgi:hypothetical protein
MATSTLLPPSPKGPTPSAASKIRDFFHSLLLFLLNTLRRALRSVTRIGRSSSSPLPSQHTTFESAVDQRSDHAAMAPSTAPPNRRQPPRVLPAVPLIPPKGSPVERDSKENTAPLRKEVSPLPQYHGTQSRLEPGKPEPAARLSERLSHLDLGGVGGIDGNATTATDTDTAAAAADVTASASSSPPPTGPISVFIPSQPLPVPEPVTPERAVHSRFMREALDMVRTLDRVSPLDNPSAVASGLVLSMPTAT